MDNSLDIYMFLNHWLYMPEIWLILGIFLIISDVLFGFAYMLIPFGIACLLTAIIVSINNSDLLYELSVNNEFIYNFINLENWQEILYWFAILSIVSVILLRLFTKNNKKENDINQY